MFEHIMHATHEEWQAFTSMLRFQWPFVLLFLCGVAMMVYSIRPFPPTQLRIATGQPNSSLETLGKQYAELFKKNGIQLEIVNTAGTSENVTLLKQGKVDVALSLGGMESKISAPDVVSLGSVRYQPFWMFYRGAKYDGTNPTTFFKGKSFSINIPGSGTRDLTEKILTLHGITIENNKHLLSMPSTESVDALLSGKIDGIFLLASIESQTIQRLMADPNIHIFSFNSAQAYVKQLNFLEPLNMPRGGFSLVTDRPNQDTQLVATTTTILTKDELHPAIQHLFLNATKTLDQDGQFYFRRPGGFPAYIERGIPVSSIAKRYYSKGPPVLEPYAPFWLSSFLDQIWFLLLAAFAIGYPLFKFLPNYRLVYADLCMTDCYGELRRVDSKCNHDQSPAELQAMLDQFDALELRVNNLWIPCLARNSFYHLKNAVEIVRIKTERLKEQLIKESAA
jgi:TRAP-type uncharacterized transport system substrate-binding protein